MDSAIQLLNNWGLVDIQFWDSSNIPVFQNYREIKRGLCILFLEHVQSNALKIPLITNKTSLGVLFNTIHTFVLHHWIQLILYNVQIKCFLKWQKASNVSCRAQIIRDLKQRERWRPGRHKWQLEVDIFSFSVLWLDKSVRVELKQRHSDSLWETESFHQARHRTSGCFSWRPGVQR